jgi:hypothetical protein
MNRQKTELVGKPELQIIALLQKKSTIVTSKHRFYSGKPWDLLMGVTKHSLEHSQRQCRPQTAAGKQIGDEVSEGV